MGAIFVYTNFERSACRAVARVLGSLMAIISASHTFTEVESKGFPHHDMEQRPKINTHP